MSELLPRCPNLRERLRTLVLEALKHRLELQQALLMNVRSTEIVPSWRRRWHPRSPVMVESSGEISGREATRAETALRTIGRRKLRAMRTTRPRSSFESLYSPGWSKGAAGSVRRGRTYEIAKSKPVTGHSIQASVKHCRRIPWRMPNKCRHGGTWIARQAWLRVRETQNDGGVHDSQAGAAQWSVQPHTLSRSLEAWRGKGSRLVAGQDLALRGVLFTSNLAARIWTPPGCQARSRTGLPTDECGRISGL